MISEVKIRPTNIDGVTQITADGWDGVIIKMSRRVYETWRKSGRKPPTPVVYILYADHFDRERHGNEIYIGHTDDAQARIDQHVTGKQFWSALLIFSSLDDWMNRAFTQNIEHKFIEWAKLANRYRITNGTGSATTHLGATDSGKLEGFLDGARTVLKIAGIDIFELNTDAAFVHRHRWSKPPTSAIIRIERTEPDVAVRIAAGSVLEGYDNAEISKEQLLGIQWDQAAKIHTFDQDVIVPLHFVNYSWQLFGQHLHGYNSPVGISLQSVLRNIVIGVPADAGCDTSFVGDDVSPSS